MAAGPTISTKYLWGSGEYLDYATTDNLSRFVDMRSGTSTLPATRVGPLVHISKYEQYTVDQLTAISGGNAGSTQLVAPLVVTALNTTASEVQVGAIFAHAKTQSAADRTGGTNPDACAVFAQGWVTSGVGTAAGVYAEGRRENADGRIHAIEVRAQNESGTNGVYTGSEFTGTVGAWITSAGNAHNAAAIQIASADGVSKWLTGFGTAGDCVTTTLIHDTSSAPVSIRIAGTHSTAAIMVEDGSGPVLIGRSDQFYTGASGSLLEVTDTTSHDPLVVFGGTENDKNYSVYFRNGQGTAMVAVSGGNNEHLTGSVTGDMVIKNTTTNKAVLLGGTTTIIEVTNANTLGFFGAAPVAQQTLVADPSGGGTQDAESRTAIIAIIDRLINLGLMAAA